MAQVTIELRHLLEMENFNLFDFDYEISDLAWKAKLEEDFINTFYFLEIGTETPDKFKHYLKRKFHDIMPYYNKLYQTTLMDLNPFITHKRVETYEGNNTNTGNVSSTDTSKTFDYPQNANPATDIASSADNTVTSATTGSSAAIDYEKIIEGLDGDQNELLKKYRENILRINPMIMKECKDLFILVY